MTKDEVFRVWAPRDAAWARWVKPVLFAHVGIGDEAKSEPPEASNAAVDLAQVVPRAVLMGGSYRSTARPANVAIVVDLPGASAVDAGVALARLGFRPVPLFNAYPAIGSSAVVNVWPIVEALERGAVPLAGTLLHAEAPPAFLLDADRRGRAFADGGMFDNRSICTRSDFPTSAELVAHGIEHLVVLHAPSAGSFALDLVDVLRGFQDGGMQIHEATMSGSHEPRSVRVTRPSIFARIGEAFDRWSLRRGDEGAFGRAHVS